MKISDSPVCHLVYSLNIHPGELWEDQSQAIRIYTAQIRQRVAGDRPFGLGLRISARAARTLRNPRLRRSIREEWDAKGFYAVTINGFPYGRFHGARVKERVYAPDWRTDERLRYTLELATILADWLPKDVQGSISTVPGSYGPWVRNEQHVRKIVEHWAIVAARLAELHERSGKAIALAIEPEPDCWLESVAGWIQVFDRWVLPWGIPVVCRLLGCSASKGETILRQHLALCMDTCHLAVVGEVPAQALAKLQNAGLAVAKIQVSAGPATRNTPAARRALRAFDDGVYLHQTRAWAGTIEMGRWPDLPEALDCLRKGRPSWDIRTHCHIPLFARPRPPLRSTTRNLSREFWSMALASTQVFEIETYTFHVLPSPWRELDVVESVSAEYHWCLRRIRAALGRSLHVMTAGRGPASSERAGIEGRSEPAQEND